jgi:hypothetical protein
MFLAAFRADALDFYFIKVNTLIDIIFAVYGQLHFFNFRSSQVVFGFMEWHFTYLPSEYFLIKKRGTPKSLGSGESFPGFTFCFALDAMSCNRTGLETLDGDFFSAPLTDSIDSLFDIFQGAFDFIYQHAFPIPDAQGKIAI